VAIGTVKDDRNLYFINFDQSALEIPHENNEQYIRLLNVIRDIETHDLLASTVETNKERRIG
jgi:hypothetical protein